MEVLQKAEVPQETPKESPVPTPEPAKADQVAEPQAVQPEEDLLTRVSKYVKDNDSTDKPDSEVDSTMFNDAELKQKIDSVEDPEFKHQLMELRKSALSGMNDKFREIADIRKDLQAMKDNGNQVPANWTPERIQSLLNDPQFVQAAQQITGETPSNGDPLEYADEGVKTKFQELEKKYNDLASQNKQNVQRQQQELIEQQHSQLASKYANYNREATDTIYSELLAGKRFPVVEDIFKVQNYETAIKNSYQLGVQDGRTGKEENQAPASIDGINTNLSSEPIEKKEGESSMNFFLRLAGKNQKAAQSKG